MAFAINPMKNVKISIYLKIAGLYEWEVKYPMKA
jgi:hypothetical protein